MTYPAPCDICVCDVLQQVHILGAENICSPQHSEVERVQNGGSGRSQHTRTRVRQDVVDIAVKFWVVVVWVPLTVFVIKIAELDIIQDSESPVKHPGREVRSQSSP